MTFTLNYFIQRKEVCLLFQLFDFDSKGTRGKAWAVPSSNVTLIVANNMTLRENVKNIRRGGGGGCRPFSPILGGVNMKLNQFVDRKKSQNGGSVHIFHQLWPDYRVFFYFLGERWENFPLENFSHEVDLCTLSYCFFWGGLDGIG